MFSFVKVLSKSRQIYNRNVKSERGFEKKIVNASKGFSAFMTNITFSWSFLCHFLDQIAPVLPPSTGILVPFT